MKQVHHPDTIALLREQIARIERRHLCATPSARLTTGWSVIDRHLGGGMLRGAIHEIASAGVDSVTASRPARFVAMLLSRHPGRIVWLSDRFPDLHAPGFAACGLDPGRLICVYSDPGDFPSLCEDVLRERGVIALVADIDRPLDLKASRRLQLAAEAGGVTGFLIQRRPDLRGADYRTGSAAHTRWRIGAIPSARSPTTVPSSITGPLLWQLDLLRQRGGRTGSWRIDITGQDAARSLPLAPLLAHGTLASRPSGTSSDETSRSAHS